MEWGSAGQAVSQSEGYGVPLVQDGLRLWPAIAKLT